MNSQHIIMLCIQFILGMGKPIFPIILNFVKMYLRLDSTEYLFMQARIRMIS